MEIAGKTTETGQVFAEPDGTFTAELSAEPVRVRRDTGWVRVDTTLRTRADGLVAPVAAASDVVFSGGGTGPLVRMGRDGRQLALTWPTRLPRPVLTGDSATYRDVLPGVDLVVTAQSLGFTHVLVVKTRDAAANPDLSRLSYGVEVSGLSLRGLDGRRFEAVDSAGTVLFGTEGARMWDSTRASGAVVSDVDGPGLGARTAAVGVETGSRSVALVPDQGLLIGAATTYPVFVDPPVKEVWKAAWNLVRKESPSTNYYNQQGADAKVGYDGWQYSGTYRSLFRFDLTPVHGATILDNTRFSIKLDHSGSCGATAADLWLTKSEVHEATWGSWVEGQFWENLGRDYGNANEAGGCGSIQPDMQLVYGTAQLRSAVQRGANGSWGPSGSHWMGLGLRAPSESDREQWKKFIPGTAKLTINYNHTPNTPTNLAIQPCASQCASPAITSSLRAELSAKLSDPDRTTLRGNFEVWNAAKTTKVAWTNWSATGVPNDGIARWQQNTSRADGQTYHFRVRACDDTTCGPWSSWFTFTSDATNPSMPTVSSDVYQENQWGGGIGITGTFEFGRNGATDVVKYLWSHGASYTPPTEPAFPDSGGKASVPVTPTREGDQWVWVQSVDASGRGSDIKAYAFKVNPPADLAGWWKLDEASGTTAIDSSASGNHGTLGDGVSWEAGKVGGAAQFTGAGCITSVRQALVTDGSSTVMALVRLNDDARGQDRTVISQDGRYRSGFELKYSQSDNAWAVVIPASDSSGTVSEAKKLGPPPVDQNNWTHLAAVYDAATQTIQLYVDGQPVDTPIPAVGWLASGPLRIGGAGSTTSTTVRNVWAGSIDDVRIHPRAWSKEEVNQFWLKNYSG
ncbi:MAG: LamG-like jellyroll fold domain-containing protein [Micromonosporaceae bacterium]